jgi:serine/threonine protein kinase
MPLAIGARLGPYEIVSPLGAGGMGEVYKAHDTRLDRMVATKVLPADKVADPDRKQRFIQEAKAASALNHPHIVTIYDISNDEGIDFIVMEYVPGKSLEHLIPAKGLKSSETLKYSIQIADALAAAHAAGIVHRDLKPANVMVTNDGQVKVLDFGLAKLTGFATGPIGSDDTTVAPHQQTMSGVIVGTISYMSPEQAEGKLVDARSDIFSFGSVVYEMLTGRKAFSGDSEISKLIAILKQEPIPLSEIVPDISRDLEKIVQRCLRKDRDRRFQHMTDLKVALQDAEEDSDSAATESETAGVKRRAQGLPIYAGDADATQSPAQLKSTLGWALARRHKLRTALGVLAAGFASLALWFVFRPPPPWQFSAQVTDRVTGVAVSGVEVDIQNGQGKMNSAFTGSDGTCTIQLPQPEPATVHIFLRKAGYERDEAVVPANKIFKTDMVKLP